MFSLLMAIVSGAICSGLPMLLIRRMSAASLISGRLETGLLSAAASRLQEALIVAQVAAAIVLMLGFGLLAKSLHRLSSVSFGFRPNDLTYVLLDRGSMSFPASAFRLHEALESLLRLPSVASAAIGSTPPLQGSSVQLGIRAAVDNRGWLTLPPVNFQAVSGSYFSAMGIPLLKGRTFTAQDRKGSPRVAIVNRLLANLVWSTDDVIGKQLGFNGGLGVPVPCDIIGVVGDARDIALVRPPEPELFRPDAQQEATANAVVLVRTKPGRTPPAGAIRRILAEADPSRKFEFSTDLGAEVSRALAPTQMRAKLLGSLMLAALLLAAGGVYASAAYTLSRSGREIGTRLALGASPLGVTWLICRRYARLAALGALVGGTLAGASLRFFTRGLDLFQVQPYDVTVFLSAFAICILAVLASVSGSAFRAAHASPAGLLRTE
jgi:hypothetical protein